MGGKMAIGNFSDFTSIRVCPVCESKDSKELVILKVKTLLESNLGYKQEWFNQNHKLFNSTFPIVKCINCSFVYSKYRLSHDLTYEYYNNGIDSKKSEAKIYKNAKRRNLVSLWQKLLSLTKLDSPIKVLDYGAGWGDFLAVANCIGVDVFGLEFDQRKIDFAQKNGIPCGDIRFIEKSAPYDIFMCNQVLEHLDKPKEALTDLRFLLKDGAIGFVSVPNFPIEVVNEQIRLIEMGKLPSKDFDPLGHLNYFDVNSLRRILGEAGFEEIKSPKVRNFRGKISSFIKKLKTNQPKEVPSLFVKAI